MAQPQKTRLYSLRERLIERAIERLEQGEPYLDKDGHVVFLDGRPLMKPPTAATMNVIRQLLKDNGIDADPLDVTPGQQPRMAELPFTEEPSKIQGLPPPEDDREF